MSRQLQRLVRSQILFREVNERVLESVGSLEGPLEFLCECSNEDCIETVALHPNLFVVTAGHEIPEVERVIDQGEGYVLVEKTVGADRVEGDRSAFAGR